MHFQYLDRSRHQELSQSAPARVSSRIWFAVLMSVCVAVCLSVVFRPFFSSHFDLTEGDLADGRFELTVLEHWIKVFHGQAHAASPNFFYPEQGVLGDSDTFFGLALPYAVLRSLGADRYLAVQLATMLLTALGFLAMYHLLRRVGRFARSTALIGAALFVISNMYYIYVVHPYILVSVMMAPALFLLAAEYWRQKEAKPVGARVWLSLCSVLLALVLYTSYYMGWFLILCAGIVWLSYVACSVVATRRLQPVFRILKAAWSEKWSLLLGVLVLLVSLIPFFMLYLPVLHKTGKRNLAETRSYMPSALGIFDVGRDSLIWGRMSARLETFSSPGGIREHPVGWPLVTVLLFLGTAAYCGVQLWRSRDEGRTTEKRMLCLMAAIALTCATMWMVGVKFGHRAPVWAVLARVVPGAAAIRVPQRIDLVLNIGVVLVCMFGLERLRKALAGHGVWAYVLPGVLVVGLVVEQRNLMPTHLISRQAEAEKFAKIPPPPKECSAFYVSNWSALQSEKIVAQTDAMMVAQLYDIPTINGLSSWFPNGWDLIGASKGHVGEEARKWARLKGLSLGFCALDMKWSTWFPVDLHRSVSSVYLGQSSDGNIGDPSFEGDDLSDWDPFQELRVSLSPNTAHSGAQSLAESAGIGSAYQDVTALEPGRRYRVSAWVASSPGATAGAQMAAYDFGSDAPVFSEVAHPGARWELLSRVVDVTQQGSIRIHLFRTDGTGTIYWDDVRVTLGEETSAIKPHK